jgi:hypothetical protein
VRTLGQKLFGVGTLTLFSADKTHNEFFVKNIKSSDATRKLISKLVEQERESKGITGREMYGAAGELDDLDHQM